MPNLIFIFQRVNEAVKEEYLQRVYKAILSNAELETIEHGIGNICSILAMINLVFITS